MNRWFPIPCTKCDTLFSDLISMSTLVTASGCCDAPVSSALSPYSRGPWRHLTNRSQFTDLNLFLGPRRRWLHLSQIPSKVRATANSPHFLRAVWCSTSRPGKSRRNCVYLTSELLLIHNMFLKKNIVVWEFVRLPKNYKITTWWTVINIWFGHNRITALLCPARPLPWPRAPGLWRGWHLDPWQSASWAGQESHHH